MSKKKAYKELREIAEVIPPFPGTSHYRQLKRAYADKGMVGVNQYLTEVDRLITPKNDTGRIQ
jgi:hypothetical protein